MGTESQGETEKGTRVKTIKTYDAATELAIEERLKALLASDPVELKYGDDSTDIDAGPLGSGYVFRMNDERGWRVSVFLGNVHIDVPNATSRGHGEAEAQKRIADALRRLRKSLTAKNREIRGTTTKQLKAEA
jgi:hypothetical protein